MLQNYQFLSAPAQVFFSLAQDIGIPLALCLEFIELF
jgi:hypothetical protein